MPTETGGFRPLLRNRRFLFYWAVTSAGDTGYAVYAVSIPWLTYQLTHSELLTALVLAIEFGTYSFSFVAGPTVDRVADLRTILLVGYPLQGLAAAAIGLAAESHTLSVPLLLGLVVAISLTWDFTWSAQQAALPRIVPADEMLRANGLTSALSGGNQIAGYAAGAGLILVVGVAFGPLLMAAFMAAGALLSLPLSAPRAGPPAAGGLLPSFREGWAHLVGGEQRPLVQLAVFSSLQAFFSGAPVLLITYLAAERFSSPAVAYALLFTSFVLGGILGSLGVGRTNLRGHVTALMSGAVALEGLLLIAVPGVAPDLLASLVGWFGVGVLDVVFYTAYIAYLQARTPPALVGRTMTNLYFFRGSSRALGTVVVGTLAALVTLQVLGATVGTVFLLVAILAPLALPAVRHLAF